ncbi:MAG: hypothetical protein BWY04_00244 [candidate division CPR1 bacterium ADurb.Bin160]|uniref:Uncharacterized protein n=1 Tax=candidate division CPR1 bacterium ADurb.Bin160 TaxID=1852826 RepID=A0A1V5ZQ03_9BACT|nr:MAG: hypothetical protein BWY04_00244 [candidate division CPR1 bacterium ADurb.Bin160]
MNCMNLLLFIHDEVLNKFFHFLQARPRSTTGRAYILLRFSYPNLFIVGSRRITKLEVRYPTFFKIHFKK